MARETAGLACQPAKPAMLPVRPSGAVSYNTVILNIVLKVLLRSAAADEITPESAPSSSQRHQRTITLLSSLRDSFPQRTRSRRVVRDSSPCTSRSR
jgi:hypothetical protein